MILTTHFSLAPLFSLLRMFPQTSATARWTSGSHLLRTSEKAVHEVSTVFAVSLTGIRTYLKKIENVVRRAVSVSAGSVRESRVRRQVRIAG